MRFQLHEQIRQCLPASDRQRAYQRGQALPLGLALLMLGTLMGIVLYNTGQAAFDKTRLANTADAAAFSGLLWQARALNFQAYTNRAMVANQVAMGQAVSLSSWIRSGRIASENIDSTLGLIPFLKPVTQPFRTVVSTLDTFFDPVTQAMFTVNQTVNKVLALAQQAMYLGAFAATPDTINKVVKANDSRFTSTTLFGVGGQLMNMKQWNDFTAKVGHTQRSVPRFDRDTGRYTSRMDYKSPQDRDAMDRRADMISDSLDPFSERRRWKFMGSFVPVSPILWVQLRRDGATRLLRGDENDPTRVSWKARDTLSLHQRIWTPKWYNPVHISKVELPIGWAETSTKDGRRRANRPTGVKKPTDASRRTGFWLGNRRAEEWATRGLISLAGTRSRQTIDTGHTGLQTYRDLTDTQRTNRDPRIELHIEVVLPASKVNNSTSILPGKVVAAPVVAAGDAMSSNGTAELYYRRPDNLPRGRRELANAYNPYWAVRLKKNASSDRALAVLTRGIAASNASPGSRPPALVPYGKNGRKARVSDSTAVDDSRLANFASIEARNAQAFKHAAALRKADVSVEQILEVFYGATAVETAADALSTVPPGDELEQQLENMIARYAGNTPDELAHELAQQIDDQVVAALKAAARELLNPVAGTLGRSLGGSVEALGEFRQNLEQDIRRDIGSLDDMTQELQGVIDRGEKLVDELGPEFERIESAVSTGLQQAIDNIGSALAEQIVKLNERIDELDSFLADELSDIEKQAFEAERFQVITDRDAQLEPVKMALAEELVRLVDNASDMYDLPLEQARQTIELLSIDELFGGKPIESTVTDQWEQADQDDDASNDVDDDPYWDDDE